jgi:mannosyltransferase
LARGLAPHFRRHWAGYAIVVLAAAGYFLGLGDPGLWLDEAYSAGFAGLPWHAFFPTMVSADGQFTAYYVFLHFWTIPGNGEFWLRTPSVIAALAGLAATYVLGRKYFGTWVGATAAALLAADPLFIALAREARPYAVAVALVTLSAIFFSRAWIAYAVAAVAAVYAHVFAAFVVLAHLAYVAISPGRVDRHRFFAAITVIAVAIVPILWITLHGDQSHLAWIAPTTFGGVVRATITLAGSPQLVAVDAVLLVLAVLAARRAATDADRLLWCWLFVPIVTALAISFVHPLLVTRYFAVVLPAFSLLLARGVCAIPLIPSRLAMAAIIVALGAANPRSGDVPAEDWRGAVASITSEAGRKDAIIVFPAYMAVPVLYYLRADAAPARLFFPAHDPLDEAPAPIDYVDFAAMSPAYDRVWLILRADQSEASAIDFFNRRMGRAFHLSDLRGFEGAVVALWTLR